MDKREKLSNRAAMEVEQHITGNPDKWAEEIVAGVEDPAELLVLIIKAHKPGGNWRVRELVEQFARMNGEFAGKCILEHPGHIN